jgi:hypothetical protein
MVSMGPGKLFAQDGVLTTQFFAPAAAAAATDLQSDEDLLCCWTRHHCRPPVSAAIFSYYKSACSERVSQQSLMHKLICKRVLHCKGVL